MTNKERLDAIKGRAMFNQLAKRTGEITHSLFTLDADDYDWLIEQVERAQELEKSIERWQSGRNVAVSTKIKIDELETQNKRYRETLEFYANRDNYKLEHFDPNINDYMSTVDYDEGQKARQTIESEANEIANKALEGGAKE